MSDTRKGSLRQVDRIDYSVYHSKGSKVPLKTPPVLTEVPIMEQEKDLEEKLRLKIKRFIDENDIDLLFDISDIDLGHLNLQFVLKIILYFYKNLG